jgi:hypothetical protein
LATTQSELAASQAAYNKAQITLDISDANHKREMQYLEREIAAYKAKGSLEDVLAELEERNNEMEELLKQKCAEIEQNDDRTLEFVLPRK